MVELDQNNIAVGQYNIPKEFAKLLERADQMLKALDLPSNFVYDLSDDDDWGFILKIHSLIDAAIQHVLLKKCFNNKYAAIRDETRLEKFVGNMNFEGRSGKIALLLAFNLASDSTIRFVRALSIVRNAYAHDINSVSKTIMEMLAQNSNSTKLFSDLVRFDFSSFQRSEVEEKIKFFVSMAVISVLWELEGSAKPLPSILGGISE